MKKIISIFTLATLLLSTGCSKDWLDINTDPNNPSSASPELILPNGVLATASVTGGYYNLLGGMYSQYWAQSNGSSQYRDIDSYNLKDGDFEFQWQILYAVALTDLRKVRNESEKIGSWNLYLQATVMEVYTWQMLVDLYDKVPYFNALKGAEGTYTPGYDDGELIYDDLIVQLNNALAKDFTATSATLSPAQQTQDLVFAGNLNRWIEFANTLKLKIYMRQMYARPTVAQAGITDLITTGAPLLTDDAKLDIFVDEQDKDNPLYASNIRNLNTKTNLRSSSTLFKYLKVNNDTRFASLCGGAPNGAANPNPMPQGGYEKLSTDLDPFSVSVFIIKPDAPVYFFSKAEIEFMHAEIAAVYGIGGSAETLYNQGVISAFDAYGLDGSSFIAAGGAYEFPTTGTAAEQQEAIIMQKWLSMAGTQGLEAFLETNRTGYPKATTVSADDAAYNGGLLTYSQAGTTNGLFPKRLLIPQGEKAGNPAPESILKAEVTDKVWWDKK